MTIANVAAPGTGYRGERSVWAGGRAAEPGAVGHQQLDPELLGGRGHRTSEAARSWSVEHPDLRVATRCSGGATSGGLGAFDDAGDLNTGAGVELAEDVA